MPINRQALDELSVSDLLRLYSQILDSLIERQVIRSRNAPAGDYAELLVAEHFGGEVARGSEKSFDVTVAGGRRLQVKCRVIAQGDNRSHSFSPFRSFDFDTCVFVVLDAATYRVVAAREISRHSVEGTAHLSTWVAGKRVNLRQVLNTEEATDLTSDLLEAQDRVDARGTDGRAGQ